MRLPIRKGGKYTDLPHDPHITSNKHQALQNDLQKMLASRPLLAKEVQRLAALGDFSENPEYQLAKGKLRGLNQHILDIQNQLKRAVIIKNNSSQVVSLGSTVTVVTNGKESSYQILGSSETDPSHGIISQNSPIGQALLGKRVGDKTELIIGKNIISYFIKIIQ